MGLTGDLQGQSPEKIKIRFIDNFFENASPLNWEIAGDTAVKISLLADYEREILNRQTDHWYFKIEAAKGTKVKIILSKLVPGYYNGEEVKNWWNFDKDISCYVSYDNKSWEAVGTKRMPGLELMVDIIMKEDSVYVVRMPPYTIADLESLKRKISSSNLVKIFNIGVTAEGRPLEIIRLGNPEARNSVIIRARAHPWEAGGNWVIEGLINEFLNTNSRKWQETFCIYIMPMANKDGVARGMTRFNIRGKDLNRDWDKESDPYLCPEKYALEKFIMKLIAEGKKPALGIDIHNDDSGGIILARHSKDDHIFIEKMKLFERLMRKYTSFSESMSYSWSAPGQTESYVSFENGMYKRFGIEAMVYELNANWIGSLNKVPSESDWIETGRNLNRVFYDFLLEAH